VRGDAVRTLSPETRAAVEEGLRRFEAGLFWDAHEAWEEAWLAEDGDLKLGLQGLIQLTAAFHKALRMNNRRAFGTLLDASLEKLEHVHAREPCFAGIDLTVLIADLHALRAASATPVPPTLVRCTE
jgi:hypothetical protein